MDALSQVTKLHVYTGMTTALQPTFQTTQHQSVSSTVSFPDLLQHVIHADVGYGYGTETKDDADERNQHLDLDR